MWVYVYYTVAAGVSTSDWLDEVIKTIQLFFPSNSRMEMSIKQPVHSQTVTQKWKKAK